MVSDEHVRGRSPTVGADGGGDGSGAPRMVVVIVHYKTPGMLRECIDTVRAEMDAARDRVVIVDGASGEEHVAMIRDLGKLSGVRLIELDKNLGFAGANNAGIRDALEHFGRPTYVMLLNPDTLVRPGAFATLIGFLESHPEAACVGPRLEYPDGTAQLSAFGDHTPVSELVRGANIGVLSKVLKRWEVYGTVQDRSHRAEWLAGACVLLRTEVLEKIGLLDDGYFMYFEETDFFRRARRAGLQSWYEPAAHVVHLVGQSSGVVVTDLSAKPLPSYWFDSRRRYFVKHFGWIGALMADVAWVSGHLLMRVRRAVTGVSHSAVAKGEFGNLVGHSWRSMWGRGPRKAEGGKRGEGKVGMLKREGAV